MSAREICAAIVAAAVSLTPSVASALGPTAQTLDAWNTVIAAMDHRLQCHPACTTPSVDIRSVTAGAIEVLPQAVRDSRGREIGVADGTIQYRRGAVFIPHVALTTLLESLMAEAPRQPDVLASRIVARNGNRIVVHLRVIRRTVLTIVYDTDHEMRFHRETERLATARSVMTREAEVVDAGTSSEHPRPSNDDRGFLWRLNSYWWYEERPDGVLAVLDSVTLSRDVPILLRPIAGPLIHRVAAESVTAALQGLRDRFTRPSRSSSNDIDYSSIQ